MSAKLFAEIGKAKGDDYRYFRPGAYTLDLGRIQLKETDDGPKWIVETVVRESDVPTLPPGTTVSWVVKLFGPMKKAGLAEVAAFVRKIDGLPDDISDVQLEKAVALVADEKKQPFMGRRVSLVCDPPKEGKKFVKHHWDRVHDTDIPF
jgi:hypothetical protein